MSSPTYSIVIPVYCESQGLSLLLESLKLHCDYLNEEMEIVIIDDGSSDDTWQILKELSKIYPALRAVRLSRNFGKEYALAAGLELAQGQAVIVMDGDLQHPPSLIPEMIQHWNSHPEVKIVEAVKRKRGQENIVNRWGAKLFYRLLLTVSGYDLAGMSDFKLLDRQAVNAWLRMDERNLFFRGMIAWMGFQRIRIPFYVSERSSGVTKWSLLNLLKLAILGITSFSSAPLHLVTASGLAFLVFAIVLAAHSLLLKLTGNAVDGFATVIILLLIVSSLIMISLGIIGIYIARIYDEVKLRPRYIVADTISSRIPALAEKVYRAP